MSLLCILSCCSVAAAMYTPSRKQRFHPSCGYVHTLTETTLPPQLLLGISTAITFTNHQMEDHPTIVVSVYTTPASFSFPTSSSTVSTLWPACLTGGSSTLNTRWRGARSMPRSATAFLAIGFFLAFCVRQGNKTLKSYNVATANH